MSGATARPVRSSAAPSAVCHPIFLVRRRLGIDRRPTEGDVAVLLSRKATSAALAAQSEQHDERLQASPSLARVVLLLPTTCSLSCVCVCVSNRSVPSRSSPPSPIHSSAFVRPSTRTASLPTLVPSPSLARRPPHNRHPTHYATLRLSGVYRISCCYPPPTVCVARTRNDVIAGDCVRGVGAPLWSAVVSTSVDADQWSVRGCD